MRPLETDERFELARPPDELWSLLTDVASYQAWWPWLRAFEGAAFRAGARWRCTVRPIVPYPVRFTVTLDEVEPERWVAATVHGDVEGTASLSLAPSAVGTALALHAELAAASPLLRTLSLVPPLARFGHDWVITSGIRQFETRL